MEFGIWVWSVGQGEEGNKSCLKGKSCDKVDKLVLMMYHLRHDNKENDYESFLYTKEFLFLVTY